MNKNISKEAEKAWEYDDRIFRKEMIKEWQKHQKQIERTLRIEEAGIPFVRGELKPDYRPHKMQLSETVKRTLSACVSIGTYLP